MRKNRTEMFSLNFINSNLHQCDVGADLCSKSFHKVRRVLACNASSIPSAPVCRLRLEISENLPRRHILSIMKTDLLARR